MKLITATIITLLSTAAFAKTIPAGTYTVDAAHSKIGFEVPHLVIATVEGRFTKFDGSITIDPKLEKSKANLNIDVSSVDTDNADRDGHLKSPDFFDAAKNPKMSFVVKKVVGTADDLKLVGDLTLKGKTKEVTLATKYLGDVNDAYGNHKIAFTATGKINRQDFGLSWSKAVEAGPVVGDEVTLTIRIEANQPIAKK
ncbi:YceI family protein [Bdellovibrio sp. SKB1291214]|uniref:YceI family protein n=1 Tax=Bdellovibrio sp. SKB1291214 TaxID=1732569 RepID=UPI000B51DC80|nr:YceI family protein [Bdellovibrio sp. SKB1291214]UYL09797.1 YceI family protein [Bdellovibrio sp. SKB1291214]